MRGRHVNLLWYATRATGEVALLFLTVVLVLGALSAIRVGGRRVPRFVIAGTHRNLTLAGLGFLLVHIVTVILDSYAPIGLVDAVVPFDSAYRPIWLGLGTLAFDLLLVLTGTSLLRTRLNVRSWRVLHWSAYGCWLFAVIHALGTGSDTRTSVFLLLTGACVALALAVVAWRLAAGGPGREVLRSSVAMGTLFALTVVAVWAAWGPLAPGWAIRSGTPARLLAGKTTAGSPDPRTAAQSSSGSPSRPSSTAAAVRGPYVVYLAFDEPGRARFTGPDGQRGRLHVDGRTITLGTAGSPQLYTGEAQADEDGRVVGVLRDAAGDTVTAWITLSPDTHGGTLQVRPGAGFDEESDDGGGEEGGE
jgi:sulfoxide reductase heme-binding subunit YedZ